MTRAVPERATIGCLLDHLRQGGKLSLDRMLLLLEIGAACPAVAEALRIIFNGRTDHA